MKAPFYKVYYIYQVVPTFRLCGFVFSAKLAEEISHFIFNQTGKTGKIVSFTRDELLAQEKLTAQ
jgi:hypothetical protein